MSVKDRWSQLHSKRSQVLTRARDAAELTIPSLMPPEGHNENTVLNQPYQSLGARGVNNLSSKLLLALMPANQPFFRLSTSAAVQAELNVPKTDLEAAFRAIETEIMGRLERSNIRTVLHMSLKHLVVTGNALMYLPKSGRNRMYPLDRYCVVRAADGRVIEVVIKETVSPDTLAEDVQVATKITARDTMVEGKARADVDVYTHVKLKDGKHHWLQEINDIEVPESKGEAPEATSPFIALRWTSIANEDYGRGHVEEYMGDLRSLEGLSAAIVSFSSAAARILILLSPNSAMDADDLAAPTGSVVVGKADDVSIFQLDKFADFRVSKDVVDDLSLRLSHAFLLTSGTVRNAERVTAEEIRLQAQELEDVLGGVYTVQSQELQLPLVVRTQSILTAEGVIQALPGVEATIVTGFDALGRGHELNKLRAYFQDAISMFGPEAIQFFKTDAGLQMLATAHNVDIVDLLKTMEEVSGEQQQAQNAALAQKAAGPAAGAMAKGMIEQQ